jgi:hypothetical protein
VIREMLGRDGVERDMMMIRREGGKGEGNGNAGTEEGGLTI